MELEGGEVFDAVARSSIARLSKIRRGSSVKGTAQIVLARHRPISEALDVSSFSYGLSCHKVKYKELPLHLLRERWNGGISPDDPAAKAKKYRGNLQEYCQIERANGNSFMVLHSIGCSQSASAQACWKSLRLVVLVELFGYRDVLHNYYLSGDLRVPDAETLVSTIMLLKKTSHSKANFQRYVENVVLAQLPPPCPRVNVKIRD